MLKLPEPPGLSRRDFVERLGKLGVSAAFLPMALKVLEALGLPGGAIAEAGPLPGRVAPVPARYWEKAGDGRVHCRLCPHRETLAPGEMGKCRVRQNLGGSLVTHAYNQPCVLNLDPIGMNPLNHFHPEMQVLAVAHAGCNLRCAYCQNWRVSQKSPLETRNLTPFSFSQAGQKMREKRVGGVSFTYTEADCMPEFAMDFAQFLKGLGLKRTLCTAGYVEKGPLQDFLRDFDAVTITYKGGTEDYYQRVVGGSLAPVLEAMVQVKASGRWLEVATLVVPTLNDRPEALRAMARWLAANLGPDTPWHLERFEPEYRLTHLPPTSQATLEQARRIGLEAGLRYVYISNLAPHGGNHTYCPSCGRTLVKRVGFRVLDNQIQGGACPACRTRIPGVWA